MNIISHDFILEFQQSLFETSLLNDFVIHFLLPFGLNELSFITVSITGFVRPYTK